MVCSLHLEMIRSFVCFSRNSSTRSMLRWSRVRAWRRRRKNKWNRIQIHLNLYFGCISRWMSVSGWVGVCVSLSVCFDCWIFERHWEKHIKSRKKIELKKKYKWSDRQKIQRAVGSVVVIFFCSSCCIRFTPCYLVCFCLCVCVCVYVVLGSFRSGKNFGHRR